MRGIVPPILRGWPIVSFVTFRTHAVSAKPFMASIAMTTNTLILPTIRPARLALRPSKCPITVKMKRFIKVSGTTKTLVPLRARATPTLPAELPAPLLSAATPYKQCYCKRVSFRNGLHYNNLPKRFYPSSSRDGSMPVAHGQARDGGLGPRVVAILGSSTTARSHPNHIISIASSIMGVPKSGLGVWLIISILPSPPFPFKIAHTVRHGDACILGRVNPYGSEGPASALGDPDGDDFYFNQRDTDHCPVDEPPHEASSGDETCDELPHPAGATGTPLRDLAEASWKKVASICTIPTIAKPMKSKAAAVRTSNEEERVLAIRQTAFTLPHFIESSSFVGSVPNYCYLTGQHGMGYYPMHIFNDSAQRVIETPCRPLAQLPGAVDIAHTNSTTRKHRRTRTRSGYIGPLPQVRDTTEGDDDSWKRYGCYLVDTINPNSFNPAAHYLEHSVADAVLMQETKTVPTKVNSVRANAKKRGWSIAHRPARVTDASRASCGVAVLVQKGFAVEHDVCRVERI